MSFTGGTMRPPAVDGEHGRAIGAARRATAARGSSAPPAMIVIVSCSDPIKKLIANPASQTVTTTSSAGTVPEVDEPEAVLLVPHVAFLLEDAKLRPDGGVARIAPADRP